jgi:hypothetical protein
VSVAARPSFQLRRLIFWDFPRATWQYDVVVALILLFIFATPRAWFRDQPRASGVVMLSDGDKTPRFFLAAEVLSQVDTAHRQARVESLIRERTGKNLRIVRLEPIEEEQEIRGFIAYTAPK